MRVTLTCVVVLSVVMAAARETAAQTPTCKMEGTLATAAQRIDSGVITSSQSSWQRRFTGGQKAFVKLTNFAPPHLTGTRLRFYGKLPDGGEKDDCIVDVIVLPGKPVVYSHSVFATKVTYNIEVSLVNDVDVANVVVDVYALKP